jgi:hypothetical protein
VSILIDWCDRIVAGVAAGLVASAAWGQAPVSPRVIARPDRVPVAPCVEAGSEKPGFDDHDGCGKAAALRTRASASASGEDCVHEAGHSPSGGGGPGLREAYAETDVLHNRIDIEIVPSSQTITGSNTFTIRSLVNGLSQFTFRLRSNFTVTGAVVNGTTPVSVTQLSTTTKRAALDRAYNAGETFTLQVSFTGVAVSRGFGSIEFTTQNGNPLVTTLSEAYYAYTWWPCKDGDVGEPGDNGEKATFEIFVTAPATMRTVSNGLLQGMDVLTGSRRRYRWATAYPMSTYLACFASTNYNTWTRTYTYPLPGGGAGSMPVEFNIYPASDTPSNRAAWEKCLDMLEAYRPIYGEYPFINEKYGIYQFNFSGGMEHQTNTGQGTFDESVTAHELGHQWWGDNVTCRTWSDIWLNEGFATYSEALWIERRPGSSGLPALLNAMAARRPTAVSDSVYCYDTTNMNRIFSTNYSYRKGAWVLHMLRHVLGDAVFFDALAQYRAAFQGSAATTADFAAAVSAAAGRDMGWFFDPWVMQPGAPAYAYGTQGVTVNGRHYLKVRLRQTQSASYPTYTMPIDVRALTTAGGYYYTLWNNARTEHYVVPVPAPASGLVFDEDSRVLWTAAVAEAFVPGPPVVVQTVPPPGASVSVGSAGAVTIYFSDPVAAAPGDFSISGPGGAVPFAFAPDAGANAVTLTPASALPAGVYTVAVQPTVTAGGVALDGEVASPADPASLPSGDGQPGGAAVFSFSVVAPPSCPADWDHNGAVNPADVAAFINDWLASTSLGTLTADFDLSGAVNPADVAAFVNAWAEAVASGAGC